MHISEVYSSYLSCTEVSTDTRNLKKGSMFFALKGPNFNANQFALKALDAGCNYVVIDEEDHYIDDRTILVENVLDCLQALALYHRQQLKIPVIGITGSNGKTTTKELLHAVLREKYNVYATKGNYNNHIGVPLTLLAITKDVEIAIIEMGANHAGEIEELCNISLPNYGIITNIGKAHLEGFGTIETIIDTKTALYRHLLKQNGIAFVNKKDPLLVKLSKDNKRIFFRSIDGVDGELTDSNHPFCSFIPIIDKGNLAEVRSQMIGEYNLDNMLAAMAIGIYFKVDIKKIISAIENYSPSNNRSQYLETKKNKLILDAYNANPSSTLLALNNFNKIEEGKQMVILGDMLELGPSAQEEHQKIVDELAKVNYEVILVGPIYSSCTLSDQMKAFANSTDCKSFLSKDQPNGKTILIKGSRGLKLETLQEVL